MGKARSSSKARLYALAEGQQGFFTARQAVAVGYDRRNHTYHVARGNWIREARGIYRLSRFPRTPDSDLGLWSLWSMGEGSSPKGAYSRETALALHGLSDVLPAKLHMTVPRDFGRRDVPPVLVLHREDLPETDVEARAGYRITSVLRTLLDCAKDQSLSPEHLGHAVFQALERGAVTAPQVEAREELRRFLDVARERREAEPIYQLLKKILPDYGMPPAQYEVELRKMASTLVPLARWLTGRKEDRPAIA